MEQYIREAMAQGYMCLSTSPPLAGVFFVKKKDGGLRPCVDYRGLKELLVKYPYPFPLVPAAFEQLRLAWYFTRLDLRSSYNLIRIRKGDEWKTDFITSSGHYECLVLLYGLATAPLIFQAYINEVLREFLGKSVLAYIDDILIYWRITKQLRCGEVAESAFVDLKTAFSTVPVLQQPDPERPFIVVADAPDVGQPWSHILIDFVTDLPASEGNTTILVIMDYFYKMVRFIPLKGIPTALETADLLFRNVFRQFGLSKDIVSDRGAQFTSRLWKELLAKLNITVSLTSGYHPQANGQVERVNQELGKFLHLYCQ
ncbi:hypothetical protein P4O66_006253 [Electrophorus voltai]|uniref:ribonuclease H n=1 Tax=Electrophorus voltai TaxID=2609070 RepID=A0AAD8ZIM7_9TELE|nr:hypothetical protein P4O66_006253 [Electrophorus voltai]